MVKAKRNTPSTVSREFGVLIVQSRLCATEKREWVKMSFFYYLEKKLVIKAVTQSASNRDCLGFFLIVVIKPELLSSNSSEIFELN